MADPCTCDHGWNRRIVDHVIANSYNACDQHSSWDFAFDRRRVGLECSNQYGEDH